jgi:hypothetical protein
MRPSKAEADRALRVTRIVSVVAGTCISLSCGMDLSGMGTWTMR